MNPAAGVKKDPTTLIITSTGPLQTTARYMGRSAKKSNQKESKTCKKTEETTKPLLNDLPKEKIPINFKPNVIPKQELIPQEPKDDCLPIENLTNTIKELVKENESKEKELQKIKSELEEKTKELENKNSQEELLLTKESMKTAIPEMSHVDHNPVTSPVLNTAWPIKIDQIQPILDHATKTLDQFIDLNTQVNGLRGTAFINNKIKRKVTKEYLALKFQKIEQNFQSRLEQAKSIEVATSIINLRKVIELLEKLSDPVTICDDLIGKSEKTSESFRNTLLLCTSILEDLNTSYDETVRCFDEIVENMNKIHTLLNPTPSSYYDYIPFMSSTIKAIYSSPYPTGHTSDKIA